MRRRRGRPAQSWGRRLVCRARGDRDRHAALAVGGDDEVLLALMLAIAWSLPKVAAWLASVEGTCDLDALYELGAGLDQLNGLVPRVLTDERFVENLGLDAAGSPQPRRARHALLGLARVV